MKRKAMRILKNSVSPLLFVAVVMLFPPAIEAHVLWLSTPDYYPAEGKTVTLEVGFGHKYPVIEPMKEDRTEAVTVQKPDGKTEKAEKESSGKYIFNPQMKGTYAATVSMKDLFMSVTTEGRKPGNKKTLHNVVSCTFYSMKGETFFSAGKNSESKTPSVPGNQALVIVPLTNPVHLKIGDELPIRVDFSGKPLIGAKIVAVDKNTALEQPGKWLTETKTDEQGSAKIKIGSKGPWLVVAAFEKPFADTTLCDKEFYQTTATFMLR